MKWEAHMLAVVVCSTLISHSRAQHYDNVSRLMTNLLNGYDNRQRPIFDQSKPLEVNVTFELLALQDIDELAGTFKISVVPIMIWFDDKLRWDASEYGGMSSLIFQAKDIWHPKLDVSNSYTNDDNFASEGATARVFSFGMGVYTKRTVFEATCSVDVKYYPFDTQVCWLALTAQDYLPQEISLVPTFKKVQRQYYIDNGEWTFVEGEVYIQKTQYQDTLVVTFTFERQSQFLMVNMLLPILFMASMNILVFVIPPDAGERISYSVTVLLALAVYLTIVGDNLPKSSKPLPIFCNYLMAVLAISVSMGVATILNLRIYHKSEESSPPAWCRCIVRTFLCRRKPRRRKSTVSNGKRYITHHENWRIQVPNGQNVIKESENNSSVNNDSTWKDVSFVLDVIFFFIFVIISVTVNLYYILKLQRNEYVNELQW